MQTTTQAIAQVHEERLKREEEEARWSRYRAEANLPAWLPFLAMVFMAGGMLFFAGYLIQHPTALRSPYTIFITPVAALLYFGSRLSQRREKAIIRAIKEEAPALFEKLKIERIIR